MTQAEEELSASQQSAQTAAQGAIGASVAVGGLSSALSASSSQGAWSSINQYQLYLLIPLIGAYIHSDLITFLEGFNFAFFSFDFIPWQQIWGIKDFLEFFPEDEYEGTLQSSGLQYVSTFRNILMTLCILVLIILLHIGIILPLYLKSLTYGINHWFNYHMEPVFLFFNFTIYIRVVLEAFMITVLSCAYEHWNRGITFSVFVSIFMAAFV